MEQEKKHQKLVELHDELMQLKEIKRRARACGCLSCKSYMMNFEYTIKAYATWGVGTSVRRYQKKWMRVNWKHWWVALDLTLRNPKHAERVDA